MKRVSKFTVSFLELGLPCSPSLRHQSFWVSGRLTPVVSSVVPYPVFQAFGLRLGITPLAPLVLSLFTLIELYCRFSWFSILQLAFHNTVIFLFPCRVLCSDYLPLGLYLLHTYSSPIPGSVNLQRV